MTMVVAYDLNSDSDFDVDACDLGALAFDYAGLFARYPSANLLKSRAVDESNIRVFLDAFNNAFNQ